MTPKEKAKELFDNCSKLETDYEFEVGYSMTKEIALIAVENEYNSLREMLFNLRSCHVIESEKVYLHRLQELIDEEQQVKNEIKKL